MLDISAIQLESSLSEIGTIEGLKARAGDKALEAQLSDMMAISQNISGLKTVTQKELVLMAEKHWQEHEQLKKENRKVLDWSGDEGNDSKDIRSETNDKNILGGISVDEPWKQLDSVPISPSHIKMQLPSQMYSGQNSVGAD